MSDIINQNTEPLFIFDMPDDETLSETISVKGEKGEKGDPTKLSQLENDTGFITKDASNLTNYYDKTTTDNKLDQKLDESTFDDYEIPSDFFTGDETESGTGSSITLRNTVEAVFKNIIIYGDALQNGAPTPDSPIDVEVVTGTQIVSVVGTGSRSYTIDLGDMELCKLADSRDYICKSNNKWYKHSVVGKYIIDGSITPSSVYAVDGRSTTRLGYYGVLSEKPATNATTCLSNRLTFVANWSTDVEGIYANNNDVVLRISQNTIGVTATEANEWLEDNNIVLYYQLATPVDEEITDVKLIRQLDKIYHAKSYTGTTSVATTGSLPAILTVEAFKDNWNGAVSGFNNGLDNVYTKSETNILLNDRVQFIFPKFWADAFSGDCNLIKYGDKNILIDCYNWTSWSYVKNMLDDNSVKHIDYLIVTHYHGDHEGNLENLITNGYVDSDTVIYMSAQVTTYAQSYLDEMAARIALLENNGLTYSIPQEGEILYIGDSLKFTFLNCDKDILDTYTAKNENSCSTVIFMEHGNTRCFFAGDAGVEVFTRLFALGYPKYPVDLYKMGHHGIDHVTHAEFIRQLSPQFAVQTGGIKDAVKNNYGVSPDAAILKMLGAKIYPCYMQNDYLCFESDGSSVKCLSGKPYGTTNSRPSLTYYVDKTASTNDIQDGSEEHPFSEIMQAISSIPFKNAMTVTINVAAGEYGYAMGGNWQKDVIGIYTNKDVLVTINGDESDPSAVILNGIGAWGSTININNLVVDIDNRNGIHAFESDIYLTNVTIKSKTNTSSTGNSGIVLRQNCNMTADGLRIEQCDACIVLSHCSEFAARGTVEIGTHSGVIASVDMDSELLTGSNFSFDSDSDKLAFTLYNTKRTTPVQIMKSHAAMAQTVELITSAANFDWIEIFYRSYDNIYGSTGKIYAPNGKYAALFIPYGNASQVVFNKQARAYINGTAITLDRSYQVTLANNGTQNIETQTTTGFNIERVIGGYGNDYIDITG